MPALLIILLAMGKGGSLSLFPAEPMGRFEKFLWRCFDVLTILAVVLVVIGLGLCAVGIGLDIYRALA